MKKYILITTLTILFFSVRSSVSAYSFYPCEQPPIGSNNTWYSQQVVNFINDNRAAVGLPRLQRTGWLDKWANSKSWLIIKSEVFSHNIDWWTWDRLANACGVYPIMGENLAYSTGLPGDIYIDLRNSPAHNANNMAYFYNYIGSSCIRTPWYWNPGKVGIVCSVVFSD